MDEKTLEKYVKFNQIFYAERKIIEAEVYGELLGKAVESFFVNQPGGKENYSRGTIAKVGWVFLYPGTCHSSEERAILNVPHNAILKYIPHNEIKKLVECRGQTLLALLDVERHKRHLWHRITPEFDDAPEVLQRDAMELMKFLGLAENQ